MLKDHPHLRFHLSELETFLVVVEEGSFSRAAERLCISQPSATNRVKKLESVLRVQLLNRTTRQVEPTEDGRLLSIAAREALSGLLEILGQLRDRSEAARNRVVVISTPMIAATYMPRLIHAYCERFRNVEVVLRDMSYDQLIRSIAEGDADLGVAAVDGGPLDNLLFEPLAEEPVVLVVPAKHPLAAMHKATFEMMLPYRMMFLERYTHLRERLAEAFSRFGAVLEATTAPTWPTMLAMIDTGSYITFLPRSVALANARETRVIVELEDISAVRHYGSISARKRAPSAAVQSFREHLHREFAPLLRKVNERPAP